MGRGKDWGILAVIEASGRQADAEGSMAGFDDTLRIEPECRGSAAGVSRNCVIQQGFSKFQVCIHVPNPRVYAPDRLCTGVLLGRARGLVVRRAMLPGGESLYYWHEYWFIPPERSGAGAFGATCVTGCIASPVPHFVGKATGSEHHIPPGIGPSQNRVSRAKHATTRDER